MIDAFLIRDQGCVACLALPERAPWYAADFFHFFHLLQ